jgi:hypothetical protein
VESDERRRPSPFLVSLVKGRLSWVCDSQVSLCLINKDLDLRARNLNPLA